jgi:hypothetical protein
LGGMKQVKDRAQVYFSKILKCYKMCCSKPVV